MRNVAAKVVEKIKRTFYF